MQILSLLYNILIAWIKAHPGAALLILGFEVVISAVASELPMPKETSPAAYQALFIICHALAINQQRIKTAVQIIRGKDLPAAPAPAADGKDKTA